MMRKIIYEILKGGDFMMRKIIYEILKGEIL